MSPNRRTNEKLGLCVHLNETEAKSEPAPTLGGRKPRNVKNKYKTIWFGDVQGLKPYKFVWFGDIPGPNLYKFIWFGDILGPNTNNL